jgi:hypothetical protein
MALKLHELTSMRIISLLLSFGVFGCASPQPVTYVVKSTTLTFLPPTQAPKNIHRKMSALAQTIEDTVTGTHVDADKVLTVHIITVPCDSSEQGPNIIQACRGNWHRQLAHIFAHRLAYAYTGNPLADRDPTFEWLELRLLTSLSD